MLRLLLLCSILSFAEPRFQRCHRTHYQHRFHHHDWNTVFSRDQETTKSISTTSSVQETQRAHLQTLQNELMQLEEKLQKYCKESPNVSAKELYGEDSYYLKYRLPESEEPKVSVQIKNKLIHILVTKKPDGDVKIFEDVKFLPDMVKAEDATWTLHAKYVLKIMIPYKVPLGTEFVKDCGTGNKYAIDVPAVLYPSIIYKFKSAAAEDD